MSLIINSARFLLFGPKMDASLNLRTIAKRKAINVARGAFGMPPSNGPGFTDWLYHQLKMAWAQLIGRDPNALPLPEDLPQALFATVNDTLKNRGGLHDKDLGLPNFWVSPTRATSTPFFWSLVVDYASAADPAKVASFEMALEDQLTKAGYDLNVRIQRRPLRLEIDKPKPPSITLTELWPQVVALATNKRHCVLGMAFLNGNTTTLTMDLTGEDFSAFVAGSPGSGKTQLSMAMLLSLAMTNSPDSLSMIIVDPKAVDFRPFNRLPHLAMPVVNEPIKACEIIQSLCEEMDRRTAQAARGDNSFFAHSILLYIDELADLAMSLPDNQAQKLTSAIQRLGQKGRGVGFVIIGATQRVFDIDAGMHSKLNARFVGKMRSAGDSVAASGIPGTTTNKLPGRGSFEVYCSDQQGLRIQAPFVAASDKPLYEKALRPFFDDIDSRWNGTGPGWTLPGTPPVPTPPVTAVTNFDDLGMDMDKLARLMQTVEAPVDEPEVEKIEVDSRVWQGMISAHRDGKLSANIVRRLHQGILKKSIDGYKAKMIFDAFMESQQSGMTEAGDD